MKLAPTVAAVAVTMTMPLLARAQPPESESATAPMTPTYTTRGSEEAAAREVIQAPKNAFELSFASGYTQGIGSLQSGVGMPSVAGAGVGFDLGLGYRMDPRWGFMWAGQYHELMAERTAAARGFTSTVAAQYHFRPMQEVDPWLEGGVGYRALWEDPSVGPTLMTHGFQLARVRAGLDIRADRNAAFGPMIGADATLFLFQDLPNVPTNISDPTLSTFVYAGIQGRFDIGGERVPSTGKLTAQR